MHVNLAQSTYITLPTYIIFEDVVWNHVYNL